jgi:hypothetical protein
MASAQWRADRNGEMLARIANAAIKISLIKYRESHRGISKIASAKTLS